MLWESIRSCFLPDLWFGRQEIVRRTAVGSAFAAIRDVVFGLQVGELVTGSIRVARALNFLLALCNSTVPCEHDNSVPLQLQKLDQTQAFGLWHSGEHSVSAFVAIGNRFLSALRVGACRNAFIVGYQVVRAVRVLWGL